MTNFPRSRNQTKLGAAQAAKTASETLVGEDKRRGVRLNSRVPVRLSWDADGAVRQVDAVTRVISTYGCLMVLSENLDIGLRIQVTNMVTGDATDAAIVWGGNRRTDGWEFGIKLISPHMDFWGLDL